MSEKKVTLSLVIDARLLDAAGGIMFQSPRDPYIYHDVKYSDALEIQESFMQALADHGQRMIEKGHKHAATMKTSV